MKALLTASLLVSIAICVIPASFAQEEKLAAKIEGGTSAAPKLTFTFSVKGPDAKQYVVAKAYGDIDLGPMPMVQAVAVYPKAFIHQGIKGKAIVTFTLDENGEGRGYSVMASKREFADAAMSAAVKSRFKPAKKAGQPASCKMDLIYDFPGPNVISPR